MSMMEYMKLKSLINSKDSVSIESRQQAALFEDVARNGAEAFCIMNPAYNIEIAKMVINMPDYCTWVLYKNMQDNGLSMGECLSWIYDLKLVKDKLIQLGDVVSIFTDEECLRALGKSRIGIPAVFGNYLLSYIYYTRYTRLLGSSNTARNGDSYLFSLKSELVNSSGGCEYQGTNRYVFDMFLDNGTINVTSEYQKLIDSKEFLLQFYGKTREELESSGLGYVANAMFGDLIRGLNLNSSSYVYTDITLFPNRYARTDAYITRGKTLPRSAGLAFCIGKGVTYNDPVVNNYSASYTDRYFCGNFRYRSKVGYFGPLFFSKLRKTKNVSTISSTTPTTEGEVSGTRTKITTGKGIYLGNQITGQSGFIQGNSGLSGSMQLMVDIPYAFRPRNLEVNQSISFSTSTKGNSDGYGGEVNDETLGYYDDSNPAQYIYTGTDTMLAFLNNSDTWLNWSSKNTTGEIACSKTFTIHYLDLE